MTSTMHKPTSPQHTVRFVRTVRRHFAATQIATGDDTVATVRTSSKGLVGTTGDVQACDRDGDGSAAGFFPSSAHTQGKEA
jgi:hypothetical protein